MGKIELDFRVLGDVGTNCYLLCNQETKECILIDAPDLPDRIDEMIAASGCKLCAVLLTHGHYDHILAAEEVRKRHNVQVYVSEDEKELLHSPQMNLSQGYGRSTVLDADVYHKDGAHLSLAGLDIEVFHTPGHTAGGSCYYIAEAGILFSSVTIFRPAALVPLCVPLKERFLSCRMTQKFFRDTENRRVWHMKRNTIRFCSENFKDIKMQQTVS